MKFNKIRHEWLSIKLLSPHPMIQRPLNEARVNEIAEEFDPDKFGEITVVAHGEKFWIINGQHRTEAAKKALGMEQKILCRVLSNELSLEELAIVFLGENRTLAVKALDKWIVRRVAKDSIVMEVEKTLGEYGLKVARSPENSFLQAVAALETVYKKYNGSLGRTIALLKNTWGDEHDAYDGRILRGIALLFHVGAAVLDDAEMSKKLKKRFGNTPASLLGDARTYGEVNGISADRAIAQVVLKVYNTSRQSGRVSFDL